MHCAWRLPNVGNDIQSGFLQFRDVRPKLPDTSIIRYPKIHGRYNPVRSIPWWMEKTHFLLYKKNINDTSCYVHPADSAGRLLSQYHFPIIFPKPSYEIARAYLYLPILQRW